MSRAFADTSVLLYAVGGEHPEREASLEFMNAVRAGKVELHVSIEAVQEFLFHRMRRTERADAVAQTRAVVHGCIVHPFDEATAERTLDLVAATTLRGRDAVHAATAIGAGFAQIVTSDKDFDTVPGLARVDPTTVLTELDTRSP